MGAGAGVEAAGAGSKFWEEYLGGGGSGRVGGRRGGVSLPPSAFVPPVTRPGPLTKRRRIIASRDDQIIMASLRLATIYLNNVRGAVKWERYLPMQQPPALPGLYQ